MKMEGKARGEVEARERRWRRPEKAEGEVGREAEGRGERRGGG